MPLNDKPQYLNARPGGWDATFYGLIIEKGNKGTVIKLVFDVYCGYPDPVRHREYVKKSTKYGWKYALPIVNQTGFSTGNPFLANLDEMGLEEMYMGGNGEVDGYNAPVRLSITHREFEGKRYPKIDNVAPRGNFPPMVQASRSEEPPTPPNREAPQAQHPPQNEEDVPF